MRFFRYAPWLAAWLAWLPCGAWAEPADKQALIVILLDGVRWDALDAHTTPHLEALAHRGVRGEMIPVWPSISTPNHWALATGLYPIHSGIFNNDMYDPTRGQNFNWHSGTWGHGEPIWAAAVRQGKIAGVVGGWAGAQSHMAENHPSYLIPYTVESVVSDHRASIVLDLLDQPPDSRPDFIGLYAIEVDHSQHLHGVDSPDARQALKQVDRMVGDVVEGLRQRKLTDCVNLLVVADHGMMDIAPGQTVYIDDLIDLSDLSVPPVGLTSVMSLWPKPGRDGALYEQLLHGNAHLHPYGPQTCPHAGIVATRRARRRSCSSPTRAGAWSPGRSRAPLTQPMATTTQRVTCTRYSSRPGPVFAPTPRSTPSTTSMCTRSWRSF